MMPRFAALIAVLWAVAVPAAHAQDTAEATLQEMVGADETVDATEAVTEKPAEPEPTYILSASDRFLGLYGGEAWLAPDLEICLEEGERVQLGRPTSDIASMELRGALCTRVADASEVATIVVERTEGASPVRMGATRGTNTRVAAASLTSRRPSFRIASGTRDVLDQFPVGTRLMRDTEICLERGQQVTLISNRGQRVTYRGPGCARRNTQSSESNLGGFTFGWNAFGISSGAML